MSTRKPKGEGSICKRADGRWMWRDSSGHDPKTGKQKQVCLYGKTQAEVLQKKRAYLAELANTGQVISPSSITLEKWMGEWLATYCKTLKPRALETYRSSINTRIVPYLGKAKLKNLKQKDIQEFINELMEEGLSAKSVKNIHGVLHKALQKAVELEYIKSNPSNNIALPKLQKKEMQTIPETSVKSFLSLFDGDYFQPLITFALYTGLRQGELLGLSWDNVDMEHKALTVRQQLTLVTGEGWRLTSPKHDKVRTIPLTSQAMEVLQEQKERQDKMRSDSLGLWNNDLNLVFTNQLGRYCCRTTLMEHWYRAIKESEFSNIRFHDLRHSFATFLLRAGVDFKTLSELLGHSSVNFTMSTYAHITKAMERDAADKLEQFLASL